MRRFIEDFKMKNIAFFLLFFLLVSGHSNANAVGGSIGGWRITSNVAQGIGAKITATKDVIVNGASRAVTSSANVIPTASQVGKFMGKNLGAAAVIGAMDLLLDGVDYVMDPANNEIKYRVEDKNPPYYFRNPYAYGDNKLTAQQACNAYVQFNITNGNFISGSGTVSGTKPYYCNWTATNYSNNKVSGRYELAITGTRQKEEEEKTISLANLGSRVLEQAETEVKTGNPAVPIATPVTQAAAAAVVGEAATDEVQARPIATELDKNTSYPSDTDIEGEITTPEVIDPATGEVVKPAETSSIAMKFPKACEWFPQACVFIDWVMTDPNVDSDMEVPEKEIEKQEIKKDLVKISGRSCPSDVKFDVDGLPFGIKINKAYSMQEICNTVEPLKYVFELITAVICALILLRV